jgi:hypothetical protein
MDPATRAIDIFPANSVEGNTLSPDGWLRALVYTFDERGEHAGMSVCGTGSE